jgi:hypothetical protein
MKNKDTQEISSLLGVRYESWLPKAREILQAPDSPLSVKDGVWKVSRRAELLPFLGSRILDQNLDAFRATAVKVLKERDPAFELPTDERYAASIHGKVLSYSPSFRRGLVEGLALISNNPAAFPNASHGKAEAIGILAVREILADADWVIWGSLNDLLPTLAEVAPKEFLDSVEAALRLDPCPFDELFAQEGSGVTGCNYLTGLLWALEGLAWDPDLFVRVCVLLAELAGHDPGGSWANRPSNSLDTILLPWLPQTLGTFEKRKVAVQTVLNEQPKVGWNLLLHLLPSHHRISFGSHRPEWRKTIPDDWKKEISREEYWCQVSAYSELAVNAAGIDPTRLTELVSRLDNLARPSFDKLLDKLKSEDITKLSEGQRCKIWDALVIFANKHRKFSNADWALPGDVVERIEEAATALAPKNPFDLYQHLFSGRDSDLFEEKGNWQKQRENLDAKRESAVQDILTTGNISEVIRFAEVVRSARHVGLALGGIADGSIDQYLLPAFLNYSSGKLKDLVGDYIWRRYSVNGWDWCDSIVSPDWTLNQKAEFLCQLPFSKDTWDRGASWLGTDEGLYWSSVWVNPYCSGDDISHAVAKLIEFERPCQAIDCLCVMLQKKQTVSVEQVVQALRLAVSSTDSANSMDSHDVAELIQFLQTDPSVPEDDLFSIEWSYLPLLDALGQGKPQLLEHKLATDPGFFCEVIRLIYRSTQEDAPLVKRSEGEEAIATNAWRLLDEWSTPPGTQPDGSFSEHRFIEWLAVTKAICTESGHLEVALIHVGKVLIHAPSDSDGLWIDSAVASALNAPDDENLRQGFSAAIHNSRGVYFVDPTGKPEKDLAEKYRGKAEDVENAGFQRFATTLREVADGYERDAERIIADHRNRSTEGD